MPGKAKSAGSASSGSGGPPPSSHEDDNQETVKDRVGNWSMDGLADAWDNCPLLRQRLRGGGNLLQNFDSEKHVATNGYVDKTVPSLKLNHFVMAPILKLMGENGKTLPALDRVLHQIGVLFDRSQLNLGAKRGDRIYQEGWAIRRLCGVAKKQLYRTSPPKDSLMEGAGNSILYIYIYLYKII